MWAGMIHSPNIMKFPFTVWGCCGKASRGKANLALANLVADPGDRFSDIAGGCNAGRG